MTAGPLSGPGQAPARHGLFDLSRLFERLRHASTHVQAGTFGDESSGRVILLRHDVDLSIAAALELARLSGRAGFRGTYFFRLRAPGYNLASAEGAEAIGEISHLGHAVALHWEPRHPVSSEDVLRQDVASDHRRFASLLPMGIEPSPYVSIHRPSQSSLRVRLEPPLQSTYAEPLFDPPGAAYQSDSNGRFDWQRFEALLDDARWRSFQLLIHAEWWTIPADRPAGVFAGLLRQRRAQDVRWLTNEIEAFRGLGEKRGN